MIRIRLGATSLVVLLVSGCFPDPPNLAETEVANADTEPNSQADVQDASQATDVEAVAEVDGIIVDGEVAGPETDATSQEVGDVAPEVDTFEVDTAVADTFECQGDGQCVSENLCEIPRCDEGQCVFDSVVCVPADLCHRAGVCEPSTGQCTTQVQGNGTPCDDGVRCTGPDACLNGVCNRCGSGSDVIWDQASGVES